MTTYTAKMPWGETFRFAANLTEASAPIYTVDEEGEKSVTQYQTADARHRVGGALRLALRACGRDYYAQPGDDRDDDEILDGILATAEVR